jgi:hypothetical protein
MTPQRRKERRRAKEIQDAIRKVFLRDWDPIGINAQSDLDDEYDMYIGRVFGIITTTRSEDALIDYLAWVEHERMGFQTPPREKLLPIAQKLLALNVEVSAT